MIINGAFKSTVELPMVLSARRKLWRKLASADVTLVPGICSVDFLSALRKTDCAVFHLSISHLAGPVHDRTHSQGSLDEVSYICRAARRPVLVTPDPQPTTLTELEDLVRCLERLGASGIHLQGGRNARDAASVGDELAWRVKRAAEAIGRSGMVIIAEPRSPFRDHAELRETALECQQAGAHAIALRRATDAAALADLPIARVVFAESEELSSEFLAICASAKISMVICETFSRDAACNGIVGTLGGLGDNDALRCFDGDSALLRAVKQAERVKAWELRYALS